MKFRAGEIVEIRSLEEILATLDENGRLEEMPFMPEMVEFCGQRSRVFKSAHKTCDTITCKGLRSVSVAVHLEGLRCNGAAHGGCQAECMLFWKEAWLKKADSLESRPRLGSGLTEIQTGAGLVQIQVLHNDTVVRGTETEAGGPTFVCQATNLLKASEPIAWWNPTQYGRDILSGNVSLPAVIKGLGIEVFNRLQRLRDGRRIPHVEGRVKDGKTPKVLLDLEPGENIRVKTKEEIMDTLNPREKNRGLSFDAEMTKYCGGEFAVHKRVQQIINEKTGKMMQMKGDCIILEDVICRSFYHLFCPRAIYPYWREIWLSRRPSGESRPGCEQSCGRGVGECVSVGTERQ